jgi:hypothetical protein
MAPVILPGQTSGKQDHDILPLQSRKGDLSPLKCGKCELGHGLFHNRRPDVPLLGKQTADCHNHSQDVKHGGSNHLLHHFILLYLLFFNSTNKKSINAK